MEPDFFLGLDLAQVHEYSALAIVERPAAIAENAEPVYFLRHLQRWSLGTSFATIIGAVARLAASDPLNGSAAIVVDLTAVGRPVLEVMRRVPVQGDLIPVTITAGHAVIVAEDGCRHIPKKELVSCLQLLLQGRRLKIARTLPDADILVKELETFRARATIARNETVDAWREGPHDDLVLAAALACWQAGRYPRWGEITTATEEDSLMARAPRGVFASDLM